jgi:hypothetical protein
MFLKNLALAIFVLVAVVAVGISITYSILGVYAVMVSR